MQSKTHPTAHPLMELGIIAGILAATSLIGLLFFAFGFSDANIITIFILGVLVASITTTRRVYGAVISLFSVLLFNYLFTEPRFSLHAYNPEYPFTFFIMFTASMLTSSLTAKVKFQAVQQAQKARLSEILLETSQMLQQAENSTDIIQKTSKQVVRLLNRNVTFSPYRPTEENAKGLPEMREDEAGLHLTVRSNRQIFAAVHVDTQKEGPLDAFEKNLLISMLGECALALEKNEANETRSRMELEAKQEQLRANLLRTISHDLRTPLTSISGNASLLLENAGALSTDRKTALITDIREDADWLTQIVENLLSATRIENGTFHLKLEPELVEEVVAEALNRHARLPFSKRIRVVTHQDLLMAWMDSRLILQVLLNLLDNAEKYAPAPSPITVSSRRTGDWIEISVSDEGPGIPAESRNKIFDMFVRIGQEQADRRRGLGLGLYLCRIIVQEHGGRIWVEERASGGASFCFTLPAREARDDQTKNSCR